MKVLQTVVLLALLVISTFGLSGEGPVWTRYVGSGLLLVLLMLILQQISNIPTGAELRRMLTGVAPPPAPADLNDDGEVRERRSARN